ncbi:protein NRT1/ PTR FAMILY 2.12-like [Macadamia integrifolia]|uniref:protein NRT1/ PTR FAMILY 2.12-like n=1 Tax=Macadamia integrifolia TaxID=60698 RepID=UPI001C4FA6B5|nr:protein NRT1/ PTR FAMILY 2.12-like [Macadamia integrifolia]
MAVEQDKTMKKSRRFFSSWILCSLRCFPFITSSYSSTKSSSLTPSPTKNPEAQAPSAMEAAQSTQQPQRKHGGWKTMPYILGNETFERLATLGMNMNFMLYLVKVFHLDQVSAIYIINIWSGITNFSPLLGAFICDAYLGRFRTLAFASFASFLGLMGLTLTAVVPALQPPTCSKNPCLGPTTGQLGFLFVALGFQTIGAAGIRPASLPFGVDQFDPTTEEGKRGINSFFNWSYTTLTLVILISVTLIVYIQSNVSWALGLGLPTAFMGCSIILFWLGTRLYVYVPPEGSVFSGIVQVFVAGFHKRHLKLPPGLPLYDPPMKGITTISKLPLTHQFRFLNKAAIVVDGEIKADGSLLSPWRLCSIQQIEEVKCLIGIVPIWASNIICFLSITQQGTFMLSQALKMDRHLGPKFQIPPSSIGIVAMITLGIWVPIYDRIIVPSLRRITKHEGGITLLQRIGIGMLLSILSMVVAGIVEWKRRALAIKHAQTISIFWLIPQLILMGLCDSFNLIGQMEFYYKQFPEHMKSISNSLISCTMAGANYLSALLVMIVHHKTRKHGHDWLDNDINAGRIDYFYFLIAAMGVFNFIYFLICAHGYHYKGSTTTTSMQVAGEDGHVADIELNSAKH